MSHFHNNAGKVHQIQASAGSGKTHTLISTLLELFTENANNTNSIKEIFSSILAITFTNATAIDMKNKLVTRLKTIALNENDKNAMQASKVLDAFIEHYSSVNIRTIDSFLFMLLRQNILDVHLSPSFKPIFGEKEFFNPLLDYFAITSLYYKADKESEEAKKLKSFYNDIYETRFQIGAHKGFVGIEEMRSNILNTFRVLKNLNEQEFRSLFNTDEEQSSEKKIAESKEKLKSVYHKAYKTLKSTIEELDNFILEKKNEIKIETMSPYRKACEEINNNDNNLQDLDNSYEFVQGKLPAFFKIPLENLYAKIFQKKTIKALNENEDIKYELMEYVEKIWNAYKQAWLSYDSLQYISNINLCIAMMSMQSFEELTKEKILFSRVLELLSSLIKNEETFSATMLERLPYNLKNLLIDEFQDTSDGQWDILSVFAKETLENQGSLTYVGDIKQAIYSWRGGNTELFENILKEFTSADKKCLSLEENWRSSPSIVDFNNQFFEQLKDKDFITAIEEKLFNSEWKKTEDEEKSFAKKVYTIFERVSQQVANNNKNNEVQGRVSIHKLDKSEKEDTGTLAETVLKPKLLKAIDASHEKYDYKDMAILVRTNTHATKAAEWLTSKKIPVLTEKALKLADNFLIKQCISFLEFLKDTENKIQNDLALWHVVAFEGLFTGVQLLTPENLFEGKQKAIQEKKDFNLLDLVEEKSKELFNRIQYFIKKKKNLTLYELLCELFEKSKIFEHFPNESGFTSRFLELSFQAQERNISTLITFLEYWNNEGNEEKLPMPEGIDAVQILTIHKSKGVEFKVVFVWDELSKSTGNSEDKILKYYDENSGLKDNNGNALSFIAENSIYHDDYNNFLEVNALEMLNRLYVAFTRAKEELHIFYYQTSKKESLLEMLLHDFIDFEEKRLCQFVEDKDSNTFIFGKSKETKKSEEIELVTNVNLSLSPILYAPPQLNYQEIKADKDEISEEISARVYGIIVHSCLEYYFKLAPYNKDCEKNIIFSILSKYHLNDNIIEDLEKEINNYFVQLKEIPELDFWLENALSEQIMLDENNKTLRCDLCVITEKEICVIDFKTGQEHIEEHKKQIEKYISALKLMSAHKDKNFTAKILYFKDNIINTVDII